MPPIVSLHAVGKTFDSGTVALRGLDLAVRAGEFVSLLGPSGCGKSTALRIVAGLSAASEGAVEWPQRAPDAGQGARIGFVFRSPR
jgi:NitT/TauT family transport system ATP-binding protein